MRYWWGRERCALAGPFGLDGRLSGGYGRASLAQHAVGGRGILGRDGLQVGRAQAGRCGRV